MTAVLSPPFLNSSRVPQATDDVTEVGGARGLFFGFGFLLSSAVPLRS